MEHDAVTRSRDRLSRRRNQQCPGFDETVELRALSTTWTHLRRAAAKRSGSAYPHARVSLPCSEQSSGSG